MNTTKIAVALLLGTTIVACSPAVEPATASDSKDSYGEDPAPGAEAPPAGATSDDSTTQASTGSTAAPPPAADANGETRTPAAIAEFVKARREEIRPCYDTEQKAQPWLKGDLVIRFVLDPAGKVKKAIYVKDASTISSDKMAECAIAKIKTWPFPASAGGMETEVEYPFNFNPRR